MELTKDLLNERRRQLEADSLAISGAIQQVDWCLEQLDTVTQTGNTDMEVENGPTD